ncbi:MAG: HD domain-containing protein [Candidatus Micrarchaeota archaeon]
MFFDDAVYGRVEVDEPLLLELEASEPVQRLKKIGQKGWLKEFDPGWFTRYNHSIGTMLLLKRLGAGLEEQAAGLVHDVAHLAFSHVADWVFGTNEEESLQDKLHEKFVLQSEIPKILEKHGFDSKRFMNLENFRLLERPLPELCADRLDYGLRHMVHEGKAASARKCAAALKAIDGTIVFTDKHSALSFAEDFLWLQTTVWASNETVARYKLLSTAIKTALEEGTLAKEDMFLDDESVLAKLRTSQNPRVLEPLAHLGKIRVVEDRDRPHVTMKKKFRYVDPAFLEGGKVCRLSENDSRFKKKLGELRKQNELGASIRFVD